MTTPEYAELHLHTAFSFLDGASLPEELVGRAADLGYRWLAITDHDGLHGAMEFAGAAAAAGIAPITGAELTLADGAHLTLLAESAEGYANLCRLITAAHHGTAPAAGAAADLPWGPPAGPLATALAAVWDEGEPPVAASGLPPDRAPRLDPGLLPAHAAGLTLLTGCRQGHLARLVDTGQLPAAEALLRRYAEWFGADRVVVELQQNLAHGDTVRVARLVALAERVGLPYAATGNVHYHHRERHRLQDVLVAIRHRSTLDASHRVRRPNAEFALRSAAEVAERFRRYPRALRTTLEVAERCGAFSLARDLSYRFPDYPCPPGQTPDDVLAALCATKLAERYPDGGEDGKGGEGTGDRVGRDGGRWRAEDLRSFRPIAGGDGSGAPPARPGAVVGTRGTVVVGADGAVPAAGAVRPSLGRVVSREEAAARVAEELALIRRHGLAGFFLLHRDLLELAREVAAEIRGTEGGRAVGALPPGRGRGSSVSSIVCYLIGLSPVDPLLHNLSLGRFLNEDLPSVPDIDLDFPREIREQLIERVQAKYPGRAALVCAFPTYRLRSAVRDVGKALGLPAADLDRIARLSEPRSAKELAAELARLPEYAARMGTPPWCHLVELAAQLAGFPRHVSQHVGGMIVASRPLTECVPLQPAAMAGRTLCQWDKDSCDDARFVKIDFLALGMLSLVEECLGLIARRREPVDLSRIDFADRRVYAMVGRGDTIGVFQIESRAQIQMLLRTRPEKLEDLIVQVAIVRPGPIVGGAVTPYVQRREQPNYRPAYDHPFLEPILRETLGVVLYQEQVIDVAMALSGFTAGQADQLRRAMTRKRSHEAMTRLWKEFREGADKRGVTLETAKTVFRKLLGFAQYGFPKSHAASFGVLAYQSCWLKHYYPAEFTCALLNNQPMGFYPPHVLTNDAKRHGLRVLPPDVNASGARCAVEGGNGVRIGLAYVDGLGEEAVARIAAERAAHGAYRSLADFVRRVPLRSEAAESLAMVGAFDGFGLGRREALWQLGLFLPTRGFGPRRAARAAGGHDGAGRPGTPGKDAGRQLALALPVEQDLVGVALPPMPAWERMAADYAGLGLSPRWHPLALLRERLRAVGGYATTTDLGRLPDGRFVRVAGLVVCRQRPGTAKGITFLLLEDERGLVNVIVYPDLYEAERPLVRGEPFLVVEGRLQRRDRTINLIAHRLRRLDGAQETVAAATDPAPARSTPARATLRAGDPATDAEAATLAAELRALAPTSHDYR